MKLLAALLAGSLAINAALFVAFTVKPTLAPSVLRDYFPSGTPGASARHSSGAQSPLGSAAGVKPRDAKPAAGVSLWATLDTEDLPALIARLRAAGFSRTVVRAIVNARLEEKFAARMKEITAPIENTPFWKPDPLNGMLGLPAYYEQYSQISRERSRVLRELLGNDFYAYAADPTAAQKRQFGSMSAAKVDLVQRINDDYAEMTSQIRASMQGITLPEDREKLALLEREKRADLASLLSPEEFADYEMRSSPVTSRMRAALTIMDASESEFQTLFKIQQAYQERINPSTGLGFVSSDMMTQRTEAQKQQADQIKAALGEARAAEFARASNSDYQQIHRLTQRDGLPIATANQAFALRDSAAQESTRIMNDPSLDIEAKRGALKSLGQSTRQQLVNTLGQNAGTSYAQSARWVTQLENGGSLGLTPDGLLSYRNLPLPRD